MTTITINKGLGKDTKTQFDTAQELFIYLRERLSPVKIFLIDDNTIPSKIKTSIEKAEQDGENDIIDFKG